MAFRIGNLKSFYFCRSHRIFQLLHQKRFSENISNFIFTNTKQYNFLSSLFLPFIFFLSPVLSFSYSFFLFFSFSLSFFLSFSSLLFFSFFFFLLFFASYYLGLLFFLSPIPFRSLIFLSPLSRTPPLLHFCLSTFSLFPFQSFSPPSFIT